MESASQSRRRETRIIDGVECFRCGKCVLWLPCGMFSRDGTRARSCCKRCAVVVSSAWNRANRKRVQRYQFAYRQARMTAAVAA